MAQNTINFREFVKLVPTANTPATENGIIWYDSGTNKFKKVENGVSSDLTGGVTNSGTAGNLALYAATGADLSDTYVQNTQNITIDIVAQPTRSAGIAYTIPNPGDAVTAADFVVTEGTRTINGNTTFGNDVTVSGDLTVNGSLTSLSTTNTEIKDKLVTLNKGGAAASGGGSGIEIEENSSITGYVKASAARTGLDVKAPATAGVMTLRPNSTSHTYDLPNADGTLLTAVSQDSAPALGGDLDVNGHAIVSTSNGSLPIAPNGTGRIQLSKQGALTRYVDLQYIDAISLTASTTAVVSSLTYAGTTIKGMLVDYTIVEATSSKRRVGRLNVVSDGASGVVGTTVSIIDTYNETADVGVTWTAAFNANNVELSATTTANNKTLQCVVERFLA